MYRNIPNALSISRIFIALPIILLFSHLNPYTYLAALALLIVAISTDALDGYFARRWNLVSETGFVLDAMGDRAIQLALILVFLVRYSFSPLFVWLLVFRDIAIYAVRVLSKGWLVKSREMRPVFLFHTTCLRIWLGFFMLREGFHIFTGSDPLNTFTFDAVQMTLLIITIMVSYYGLIRSFSWLVDQDHEAA
jgi:phosphatidylglycerophosphate synthase